MDLFALTRALVDIESTTNHEKNVGDYLFAHLSALTSRHNGRIERIAGDVIALVGSLVGDEKE